jgi:DNA polymerase III sliding clamp (beta) subunit (PCNA family)
MYPLGKNEQIQLKNFFKVAQKINKKIENRPQLKNILVEIDTNKIIFNHTNGYFLKRIQIKTELQCEKSQLFIPECLLDELSKSFITAIDFENNTLILQINYFEKKIKITQKNIMIETDNSQTKIDVEVENYPDLNLIKDYFKVTENHFTIQLGSKYLHDLISTSKYFKLQIDLTNYEKAVIITTDNGTNAILMPMTLNDNESKDRNKEIQKRIKASDTPIEPTNN